MDAGGRHVCGDEKGESVAREDGPIRVVVESDQRVHDGSEQKYTDRNSVRHGGLGGTRVLAEGDRETSEAETDEGHDVAERTVDRGSQQTGGTWNTVPLNKEKLRNLSERVRKVRNLASTKSSSANAESEEQNTCGHHVTSRERHVKSRRESKKVCRTSCHDAN